MINLVVPLVFGLLMLISAVARMRRELYGTGMLLLVGGLVILLHSGIDVSSAANGGIHVDWISQPSVCATHDALRC